MTEERDPIPPVVGKRDALPSVSATFGCDRCGARACTVTLLAPFEADPQAVSSEAEGGPPGIGSLWQDTFRLSVDGPVGATHYFGGLATDVRRVESALTRSDAAALYAIDVEYMPAWCPDCKKSYCRACWKIWAEYDDGY